MIGNNFYCKLFFVLIPFLNEIPLLAPYFNPMMKIGLVIGALYILYDLFHDRTILKTACIVPAVALILFVSIGTLLHYDSPRFKMNIIEIAYVVVSLLVLFPTSSKRNHYRELSVINYLSVGFITIASAISVVLFFARVSITYTFNDFSSYQIGVFNGRLVGLFRTSTYPTAAIVVFCALIQLFMNKTVLQKQRCWQNKLLIISIIINVEDSILQNSKGIFISFAGGLLVLVFFAAYRFLSAKQAKPRTLLNGAAAFGIGGAAVGASYGFLALIRQLNFWIADLIEGIKDYLSKRPEIIEHPESSAPIFVDRVVDERYGLLTGRPYVWKTGLLKALDQPLFGYGPYTLSDNIFPFEGSTEKLAHFHNFFVQTLVSGGFCGLIAFLALTLCCICRLVKALFVQHSRNDYLPFLAICSLLVFIFIINMADTTILFMTKHSGFIFFIYLGYAMALVGAEKSFKIDRPAQWLDSLFSKSKKAGD